MTLLQLNRSAHQLITLNSITPNRARKVASTRPARIGPTATSIDKGTMIIRRRQRVKIRQPDTRTRRIRPFQALSMLDSMPTLSRIPHRTSILTHNIISIRSPRISRHPEKTSHHSRRRIQIRRKPRDHLRINLVRTDLLPYLRRLVSRQSPTSSANKLTNQHNRQPRPAASPSVLTILTTRAGRSTSKEILSVLAQMHSIPGSSSHNIVVLVSRIRRKDTSRIPKSPTRHLLSHKESPNSRTVKTHHMSSIQNILNRRTGRNTVTIPIVINPPRHNDGGRQNRHSRRSSRAPPPTVSRHMIINPPASDTTR